MNKEAFLHQLESAVKNNDKKLFIDTIFDLPTDVIVGFTKEEFSQIMNLSSKIGLHDVDELFDFLEENGNFLLEKFLEGIDEFNNSLICRFYYSLLIALAVNNKQRIKCALYNNATICYKLAEMGFDGKENLETAVRLYGTAQEIFPKTSADYARALLNEGNARSRLAEMGVDSKENLENAVHLYRTVQDISLKTSSSYASALMNEGNARQLLAEMGFDSKENLETAVRLHRTAQEIFPKTSADYASAIMNEGSVRRKLAEMGFDSKENLETAVRLYGTAQEILPETSYSYASALLREGNVRSKLAEMGFDSKENLETAVRLYGTAQEIFPKTSADYASALMNEGNARSRLAKVGFNSIENLENAVCLYRTAQEILPKTSAHYARALLNDGNARRKLAEMGANSKENLEAAVRLCITAQEILPETSTDYASALMNEGSARSRLAEMGVDSKENLENAVRLYGTAQEILPETSPFFASALMNEGSARSILAEMGVDSKENLEAAVHLYGTAQEIFPKTSSSYASALMNEGTARQLLAEMGVDSKENLENAVHLYGTAQEIFPKTSSSYARALLNEGSAWSRLAEMGVDSKENLETAVRLHRTAQEIFPKTSADYAIVLMNEGNVRSRLAEMGFDSKENLEKSKKLYIKSISILEKLGDGWTYSLALLNLNGLLKEYFYKTGDKKYLEEWDSNLGDIEKKIKTRNIKYKKLLRARIHEIRASLMELDGKSGISDASFEYYEAYKISKEPFYKFMKEFCQARNGDKSFCKLVDDWNEIVKEEIFLDHYNYSVFECHLENALMSTIDEEDELKLAIKKLKEIEDRTQIKELKDRVSAYIHLLEALVDCFIKHPENEVEEEKLYDDAKVNIKISRDIFRKYGDEQGQKMCEIFNKAIMERKKPDVWQEIIRNRDFSSNFYSLLRVLSDRKRADLESYKIALSRIEKKVDQLQVSLNQGFAELKGQIRKGFKGTANQVRLINGKINNIETEFEYLVQISDEVDSKKEGASLREFVAYMMELIRKGDDKASETLMEFSEKIVKEKNTLLRIIENSGISEEEKVEGKSSLANFSLINIQNMLAETFISFGGEVTKQMLVSLTAEIILKLLMPVLLTAIPGAHIVSLIAKLLLESRK